MTSGCTAAHRAGRRALGPPWRSACPERTVVAVAVPVAGGRSRPARRARLTAPWCPRPAASSLEASGIRYVRAMAKSVSSLVIASRKPRDDLDRAGALPRRHRVHPHLRVRTALGRLHRVNVTAVGHRGAPRQQHTHREQRARAARSRWRAPAAAVASARSAPTSRVLPGPSHRSGAAGVATLPARRLAPPPAHRCPAAPSGPHRRGRGAAPEHAAAGQGRAVGRRLRGHGRQPVPVRCGGRGIGAAARFAASPPAPAVSANRAAARPPYAAGSAGTASRRRARPTPAASRRAAGRPRRRSTARARCRRSCGPATGRPARSG